MLVEDLVEKSARERQLNGKNNHFIVAIGASAGGLEAINAFFDNMFEIPNLSLVIIQHLSADYKRLLVELIAKHTHMKVFEAIDGMKVHKSCVYIIPNRKLMTIKDGKLRLIEETQTKVIHTTIDHFLNTLAGDQKEKAIAIILSGIGTDGTKGIDAIKHCGGIVMVQDPVSAKFNGMPNSAITSGNADFILPPEMMPEAIYNHIQESPIYNRNKGKIDNGPLNEKNNISSLTQEFSNSMMEDFGYVCFFIDDNFTLKEAAGNYSKFLSEEKNPNILKMVSQELSVVLNTAVRKSWKEKRKIFLKSVQVKLSNTKQFVSISITPPQPLDGKPNTLIILGEHFHSQIRHKEDSNILPSVKQSQYVANLETELIETHSNLQIAIEGLETFNEELQTSNEELQSVNQELQTNNNELVLVRENLKKLNTELENKVEERTKKLSESEERFRLVSQSTNDAIWDWNLADNSIWWSESFYKLFQYTPDPDIHSYNFWISKVHPEDSKRVQESLDKTINSQEEQWNEEYRFLKADGTYAFILDRGHVLHDEYGTPYRMLGSMLDISLLRDAEQKIISSEGKFRRIFDSDMIGMVFTKADGLIINANNAFLTMFGYTREDLENGKVTWQNITPADCMDKNLWAKEQLYTNGVIPSFENEYLRKDGKRLNVLLGAASLDEQDAIAVTYMIDISDKKEAEAKEQRLQKVINNQQEEFKSIFMNAPALISIRRGTDLKIDFINKAVADYFGHTDLQGKSNKEADDLIKEVYRTGKPYFGKAFHLKLDKYRNDELEDMWFDLVYQPVLDINGNIDGVATFAFDVSEMIRANQKIKKNEERFRSLANSIPQKVWTALPDGQLDYFNKVFLDYTGKSCEELIGSGWESIVHKDDRARNKKLWRKALKTGQEFELERRLLGAEGTYRWHLSRAVPQFDEKGNIIMWVATSTDIDDQKNVSEALKASEDYFRQLSDQAPFMIWKVDTKGICNYVNKQWTLCTGLSFEESLNLGWSQAFHPDDVEKEYEKFMEAFNSRTTYRSKFRVKFIDGEYHWVLAQSNAIESDVFEGYIGSLTDITEQETAQEAMKLLMQKKDEFMSIASHELKTPITSMKGSLQIADRLARRNSDINEIRSFIGKANKQVNRLTGLVDDLLDVTKITAGQLKFHPSEFAIGEAIQDCLDQIESNATSHKIFVDGDKNIVVKADMHRLEQVLTNFLSNAIKYSPEADKVLLNISKEHKMLKISITDFGIGIPDNKKNFVFDRFFRVQESSEKFSGLGLGLFISAEIIRRHGGKVGVISEENKGSTFWFSLPL